MIKSVTGVTLLGKSVTPKNATDTITKAFVFFVTPVTPVTPFLDKV